MKEKTELEIAKERYESAESIVESIREDFSLLEQKQAHFDKYKPTDELRDMWIVWNDGSYDSPKFQKILNYRALKVLGTLRQSMEDEDSEWDWYRNLIDELTKQHGGE